MVNCRGQSAGPAGLARVAGLALLWLGLACPGVAAGAVTAWLERDAVPADESLTLHLTVHGEVEEAPDWSVLLPEFEILHRARQTRIRADDQGYRQETAWELGLMPRGPDVREVPAVPVGIHRTPVLAFERLAPEAHRTGGGDVFVEARVSTHESWVLAELVYTTRLHLAVGARGTRLSEPRVIEGEASIRRLGEPRQYQLRRDGRHYLVWEQHHAVVPQRSGTLVIDAVMLDAELSVPGQRSRRIRVHSQPVHVAVREPPPRPAELPEGPWLPATAFELRLEGPAGRVRAGEPVTLELVATARGASPAALTLPPPESLDARLRLYPERPRLDTAFDAAGLSQIRHVQSMVLLATAEGSYPGLEVRVPWFDTGTGRWTVAEARLPPLEVEPAAEPVSVIAYPDVADPAGVPGAAVFDPWKLTAGVLGLGWVLTLAWGVSSVRAARRRRRTRSGASRAAGAPARSALRRLGVACRRGDAPAARDALLSWGRVQWPDAPPRAVGALAERLPEELAGPVQTLSRTLYAGDPDSWQGKDLAAVLDALQRLPPARGRPLEASDATLPPLWNGAAAARPVNRPGGIRSILFCQIKSRGLERRPQEIGKE